MLLVFKPHLVYQDVPYIPLMHAKFEANPIQIFVKKNKKKKQRN